MDIARMHASPLVFEANLLRFDGTVFGVEILRCTDEAEALRRASQCATRWAAAVRLYQVPYVNEGSDAWDPDAIRFVANVPREAAPLHPALRDAKGITLRAEDAASREAPIAVPPARRRVRQPRVGAELPLAATA